MGLVEAENKHGLSLREDPLRGHPSIHPDLKQPGRNFVREAGESVFLPKGKERQAGRQAGVLEPRPLRLGRSFASKTDPFGRPTTGRCRSA